MTQIDAEVAKSPCTVYCDALKVERASTTRLDRVCQAMTNKAGTARPKTSTKCLSANCISVQYHS